jgi:hypothetical protein
METGPSGHLYESKRSFPLSGSALRPCWDPTRAKAHGDQARQLLPTAQGDAEATAAIAGPKAEPTVEAASEPVVKK